MESLENTAEFAEFELSQNPKAVHTVCPAPV